MNGCECEGCFYLGKYRKPGNTRTEYKCMHGNVEFIENWFREHKIQKMPGFLGFGTAERFPLKRTPKWCPRYSRKKPPNGEVIWKRKGEI